MARYGKDSSGRPTYNGQPYFPRILYDSGFEGATGTDMAGHVAARRIDRFKITEYLQIMSGTFENGLRLADVGVAQGWRPLAIGNFHQGFSFDPNAFDISRSASYRSRWNVHANSGLIYLGDEARDQLMSGMSTWASTYKQQVPEVMTLNVTMPARVRDSQDDVGNSYTEYDLTHDGIVDGDWPTPYRWASGNFGDMVGPDPYPGFAGNGGADYPQGYMWNDTPHTVAQAVAAARQHGKIPVITLQAFKFTAAGRVPNRHEMWYQTVASIVEGAPALGYWALGVQNGALHHGTVTAAEREATENHLIEVLNFLAQYESVLLLEPRPQLLVGNSTDTGNPVQWLIDAMQRDIDNHWSFFAKRGRRGDRNALQAGVRTKLPMLNQAGDIRTRVLEDSNGIGYVFAYNYSPFPTNDVAHRWYRELDRVEVLGGESRTITLGADKRTWLDSYGGSSSKNMASRPCHVYRLVPSGSAVPPAGEDPALVASPNTLAFTATQGQPTPSAKSIAISNPGAGTLNWTVSADVPWITLAPESGSDNGTVVVNVSHAQLGVGTHTGTITINGGGVLGSPKAVVVTFAVFAPPQAPAPLTVAFDTPPSGTGVNGAIVVRASSQGGRSSQSFEFYLNGELLNAQPSTTRSAEFVWDTTAHVNGSYELEVVVTDSDTASASRRQPVTILNSTGDGVSETPGETPPSAGPPPIELPLVVGKACGRVKVTLTLTLSADE